MAETIHISSTIEKGDKYKELLPQLKALVEGEPNLVANLANISAALKEVFNFFWVGFYLVDGEELVLGPFQGPVACTRIKKGKGVCGSAWAEKRTLNVPDVEQFPGHIACSEHSKSEIVVPIVKNDKVEMVLDIDSYQLLAFDETDEKYLDELAGLITSII